MREINIFSKEEYDNIKDDIEKIKVLVKQESEKDLGLENLLMGSYERACVDSSNNRFFEELNHISLRYQYGCQGLEKLWNDSDLDGTDPVEFSFQEKLIIESSKPNKLQVIYEKVKCEKCDGCGIVRPIGWVDWFIVTCKKCKGKGKIEINPKRYYEEYLDRNADERVMFLKVYDTDLYSYEYPDDVFVVDR